jgi:hypothetical protein
MKSHLRPTLPTSISPHSILSCGPSHMKATLSYCSNSVCCGVAKPSDNGPLGPSVVVLKLRAKRPAGLCKAQPHDWALAATACWDIFIELGTLRTKHSLTGRMTRTTSRQIHNFKYPNSPDSS